MSQFPAVNPLPVVTPEAAQGLQQSASNLNAEADRALQRARIASEAALAKAQIDAQTKMQEASLEAQAAQSQAEIASREKVAGMEQEGFSQYQQFQAEQAAKAQAFEAEQAEIRRHFDEKTTNRAMELQLSLSELQSKREAASAAGELQAARELTPQILKMYQDIDENEAQVAALQSQLSDSVDERSRVASTFLNRSAELLATNRAARNAIDTVIQQGLGFAFDANVVKASPSLKKALEAESAKPLPGASIGRQMSLAVSEPQPGAVRGYVIEHIFDNVGGLVTAGVPEGKKAEAQLAARTLVNALAERGELEASLSGPADEAQRTKLAGLQTAIKSSYDTLSNLMGAHDTEYLLRNLSSRITDFSLPNLERQLASQGRDAESAPRSTKALRDAITSISRVHEQAREVLPTLPSYEDFDKKLSRVGTLTIDGLLAELSPENDAAWAALQDAFGANDATDLLTYLQSLRDKVFTVREARTAVESRQRAGRRIPLTGLALQSKAAEAAAATASQAATEHGAGLSAIRRRISESQPLPR